ncbi:MAG: ParB/RepB/Spo0J family partition protein [Acidimicrobiia bacterium]
MSDKRSGLGRGLSALIPDTEGADTAYREVHADEVRPNPRQPRRTFDETALEELAASIKEVGLLQPIVVHEEDDGYVLLAGERRLRACRLAGLTHIPAIVRADRGDDHRLSDALVENVQREQLRPLEEAAAYQELVDDFGWTHEHIAQRVGKSRTTITNSLRLLGLPAVVQGMVDRGDLAAGHARALLGIEDKAYTEHIARRAADEGWSVRQVEEAVRARKGEAEGSPPAPVLRELRPPAISELEERLAERLGTKVTITHKGQRGRVVITYGNLDDLERIARFVYGR